MHTFIEIVRPVLGLIVGAGIGYAFGFLQDAALRKHQQQVDSGTYKNGWTAMPGSGARVALLLIALVAIQFICPMLFADGTQWWVSGGLLAGYASILYKQFRQKRAGGL